MRSPTKRRPRRVLWRGGRKATSRAIRAPRLLVQVRVHASGATEARAKMLDRVPRAAPDRDNLFLARFLRLQAAKGAGRRSFVAAAQRNALHQRPAVGTAGLDQPAGGSARLARDFGR